MRLEEGSPTVETQWPQLALSEWRDTSDHLHLWTQVIGKVRMVNEATLSHWWNIPLYVTARGKDLRHRKDVHCNCGVDWVANEQC